MATKYFYITLKMLEIKTKYAITNYFPQVLRCDWQAKETGHMAWCLSYLCIVAYLN